MTGGGREIDGGKGVSVIDVRADERGAKIERSIVQKKLEARFPPQVAQQRS